GDFQGADFSGADLRGAHLAGADLRGADLRGANLEGAFAPGDAVKLDDALLGGAVWIDGRVCGAESVGTCD
ncbi:MAG: pentapeptide repeat-containing protein, partial [Trueperaceae bacterium]|nr:pentapeptide repeat-containing protein [Trueperaceae bacterium]